jgi:hypothetical protein
MARSYSSPSGQKASMIDYRRIAAAVRNRALR